MICPRCQAENREGRRFCSRCGAALACASCGFSNDPGDEFCGGCGVPLRPASATAQAQFGSPRSYMPTHLAEKILTAKAAVEGERKQVTVLFADLKGSLELIAKGSLELIAERDPEEAHALLDPVLERLGFRLVREREHIAMVRENPDGKRTVLTMPNHLRLKGSTLRTICTQAGIARQDFMRAYAET